MKRRTAAAALLAALVLNTACSYRSAAPEFVYNTAALPPASGTEHPGTVTEETAAYSDNTEDAPDAASSDEGSSFTGNEDGQAAEPPKSTDTPPKEETKQPEKTTRGSTGSSAPAEPDEETKPPHYGGTEDTSPIDPPTEQSEPIIPDEEDEVPPIPDKPADITVTYDPLHSISIELDGFAARIYGSYQGAGISSVKMHLNRISGLEIDTDGESFDISFSCSHPLGEYDSMIMVFDDGHEIDVRIRVSGSGFEPLESPALERNRSVPKAVRNIPREGLEQYIGGDAKAVLAEIQSISNEICRGITGKYNKARAIAGWVAENIYYDSDASESSVYDTTISLAQTLKTHRTVCGGFANLYSALCAAQGIRCLNIIGSCVNGYNSFTESPDDAHYHEWTALDLGGRLIWVDTTWNTFNKYSGGKYIYKGIYWQYFDISDELISNDHRADLCEYRGYFSLLD